MEREKMSDTEVSQKSPFAGCAILIAAVAVMLFLVVFSITVLFRQFGEIAKFTGEEPAKVELVALEGRDAEVNRLAEKLEGFRQGMASGETAVLELNAEELNLAIAVYEPFEDLRGMLRVAEVSKEEMRLEISFQLNGKPRLPKDGESGMMVSDPRFLNGTMVVVPGLLQQEVVLQVKDIEVVGADVPEEFMAQMSPYRIAERYLGDGAIGEAMALLTDVELGDGVVRFVKTKGEVAKDTVSDEDVDVAGQRLFTVLGVVACVFLMICGVILFFGMRAKRLKGEEGDE
ncbi:MAG: hypothetical protein ACSHX7_09640 [Luteolibacter sp.]